MADLTIPPLMHFPLAKAFSIASYTNGIRLFIRRTVWDGVVIDPLTAAAYPIHWLFYDGGLWFVWETDGNGNGEARVAEYEDMIERDFLAHDWTTLAPGCVADPEVSRCDVEGQVYADLFSHVHPYDITEFIADDAPTVSLSSPNMSPCGSVCSPGVFPPVMDPSPEPDPEPAPPAGGGGDPDPDPDPPAGGGGGGGASLGPGGGGGGSGSGGSRGRRPAVAAPSFSLEIDTIVEDIPVSCIPRIADACGRLCGMPGPQSFTLDTFDVTLNDPDDVADIWFLKAWVAGVLVLDTTAQDGDTKTAAVYTDYELHPGASIGIRAAAWKAGGRMWTSDVVTMIDACAKDVDCGEPCEVS